MHILSMMIFPVLLLFSMTSRGVSDPTYEHQNSVTGETHLCTMCPPGTHMSAHCSATSPTKCEPCKNHHYTEMWNYLPRCLYCSTVCTGNMEVETECSAVNDRVCRCKDGFYMTHDFCVRHLECAPGHGVLTKGTSREDTVCQRCSDGSFSNSSSAVDECVNHQTCADDQVVLMPGSALQDTLCGTCDDLATKDETLRRFLISFLYSHKMSVQKMKKFISRHVSRTEETRRLRRRGPLMTHIRAWLADASREQLLQFPTMLKESQCNSLVEKIQNRLDEIRQQSPHCGLHL
ncbi:tumor necrosis factor receptor superfamily member 11B-like [Halichoeres trimaculatus]|uniref:tumor necrosis factor receptor superfamily member 11B-like n=1 Tax=Halichoeres trimaculatus TaxID=147232 RepID=UPI003D9F0B6B